MALARLGRLHHSAQSDCHSPVYRPLVQARSGVVFRRDRGGNLNDLAHIKDFERLRPRLLISLQRKNVSLKQIGSELGVAHLREGSLRRATDAVRISAELANVADGTARFCRGQRATDRLGQSKC